MTSAQQAHDQAQPGDAVIGWKLDRNQRAELLSRFPPRYPQAVADHVTLRSRVDRNCALPSEASGFIVGHSDDGRGVEAMVVQIGGSSRRPGGGTYHITWSLAPGREANESNQVIAAHGWQAVDPPVEVRLQPQGFERAAG